MKSITACLAIVLSFASIGVAQEETTSTFRLHFRVHESGDTQGTSQEYALVIQSGSLGKINASYRLPHYTRSKDDAQELHTVAVGNIIECTAGEPSDLESRVLLACAFESSRISPEQPVQQPPIGFLPVLNSRKITTKATIPLGEEVQLALLDDPSSGNRLEIFVLAERFGEPTVAKIEAH